MDNQMRSNVVRLGIIGMSSGNGHPYSWAAICNGFDKNYIEDCGFPVIPRYLKKQKYPDDFISNAKVTHIWSQSRELSEQIAKASKIEFVVDKIEEMIESVDGILLARDDAQNHLKFAKPFLDAGMPIYIDKPLALSVKEANKLLDLQKYQGQIFSCSALRDANSIFPEVAEIASIGTIRSVLGITPKNWDKYAVHIIDPLLQILPDKDKIVYSSKWKSGERTSLHVQFSSGIDAQVTSYGNAVVPISMKIIGTLNTIDIQFTDTFQSFKKALQFFIKSVMTREEQISTAEMLRTVSIIEMGRSL